MPLSNVWPDELDTSPAKAPGGNATGHHEHKCKHYKARTRGPRSMGRHPYLTLLERYLTDRKEIRRVADSTLRNERRMLRKLYGDIQELKKSGRISTTNPSKFTEKDITEIIRRLNTRQSSGPEGRLDMDTVAKYMQYLSSFLIVVGNPHIGRLKELKYLPKRGPAKEIITLDIEDTEYLWRHSQTVPGWEGEILAFIVPTFIVMGLRAQELFQAELRDIDCRKWVFYIRNPKGGKNKRIHTGIPSILHPHVIRYLAARERELSKRNVEQSPYLFPSLTKFGVRNAHYTPAFFQRLRSRLVDGTGIRFDWQMLRRTSGQILKDQGVNIEIVSKHLRHTSTVITERHYARMKDSEATGVIEGIWSQSLFGNIARAKDTEPLIDI